MSGTLLDYLREHGKRRLRHQRTAGIHIALCNQPPQIGRRGQAVCRAIAVMCAARAQNGKRLDRAAQRVQRAQILDRERVVRGGKQRTGFGVGSADRLLHGGGIGQPGGERLPQCVCVFAFRTGQVGGALQQREISLLRTEREVRDASKRIQQRNRAERKAGRRPQTGGKRRFQHQICAAPHSGFRAAVLFYDRKVAALDEIAAHRAHNGRIRAQRAAGFGKVMRVSRVKRIIFGHNAADGHKQAPLNCKCTGARYKIWLVHLR